MSAGLHHQFLRGEHAHIIISSVVFHSVTLPTPLSCGSSLLSSKGPKPALGVGGGWWCQHGHHLLISLLLGLRVLQQIAFSHADPRWVDERVTETRRPHSYPLTNPAFLSVHLISRIERTRFVDGDSTTHPPTSIQTHTEGGITTHTRPPLLRTNTPPRHDHKQLQHQSRGGEERETCFHQHQLFHSCRVTMSNNKVHMKSRSHH